MRSYMIFVYVFVAGVLAGIGSFAGLRLALGDGATERYNDDTPFVKQPNVTSATYASAERDPDIVISVGFGRGPVSVIDFDLMVIKARGNLINNGMLTSDMQASRLAYRED